MPDDWILDVLADLRSFALRNGLPALAAQMEAASNVARSEIAARGEAREAGAGRPLVSRPN